MIPFNKNTNKSLKEILKDHPSSIDEIYRVYYENSDIPLFLTAFNSFENEEKQLKYHKEDFENLYLIPNYIPEQKRIKTQSMNMQYSPKLKKAAQEIQKILTENDIAGVVILQTPGFGEYVLNLSTTYSCIKIDHQTGEIRARARLQEDFNGNKKQWNETVQNTSNMLEIINKVGNPLLNAISELSFKVDMAANAEHTDRDSTNHTTQNN